jgi:hypothetical protein
MRQLFLLAVGLAMSLGANAATEHNDIQAVNTPFDHHDNTGPYRKGAELVRHAQNQKRLEGQSTTLAAVESVDVGDVAVIVDNGSILIPPKPSNPFDLGTPSALLFVAGADEFTVSAPGTAFDPGIGGNLGLGDDDATAVEGVDSLTFPGFPFLGTTYKTDQIFVGSDGHITFGEPEDSSTSRDAGRHIGGPPRVSPDPSTAGAVHADVRTDRVVITWNGVPTFGVANSNTFQAVLYANGNIDFVYSTVEEKFGVVGVAEGGDEGPINPIDLSADLPGTFGAGAVFEAFSPAILVQQMDVIALAKEFYKTHNDEYDFLVMFSDEVVDIGGGFAFHLGLHSDTEGLGFFRTGGLSTLFDSCGSVGLPGGCEMESLLNMNRIGLYWPDAKKQVDPPIRKFRFFCFNTAGQVVPCGATFGGPPGANQASIRARWAGTLNGDFGAFGSYTLGLNSAMSIMAQEAGHRWLAFPAVVHPGVGLTNVLLGRSNAHWSFFHDVSVPSEQFEDADGDPRASGMEGNAITDLGANTICQEEGLGNNLFQTKPNELIDGYTALDQYFIGARLPGEVPSFFFIDNPTTVFGGSPNPASDARDDVLICGDRVDRSLSDITDIGDFIIPPLDSNGTRDPLIGDEQDAGPGIEPADDTKCANDRECVDVKTMAFILVIGDDPGVRQSTIDAVDTFRQTWENYANGPALGGRGARGISGDDDFIPKFDTSLNPVIH